MPSLTQRTSSPLQPLTGLNGRVITPADSAYDTARTVFYGGIDKRPSAIVRVANAGDVRRAICTARDNGRGGGNFGVVTRLQFRLNPLPHFTGGLLVLPATPETIREFASASLTAPEELSTIGSVMPAPPLPFLPAAAHGRLVIFASMAFAGDDEAAARAIAPFRSLARPRRNARGS